MPVATINQHEMYYELLGPEDAPRVVCTTGWGTFCHGHEHHLPRGLTTHFRVLVYDHRGLAQSTDDASQASTMKLRADDLAGLLDHLRWREVHLVGIAGMGACICQEVAIARPDLTRSLINSGAWCFVDEYFASQLHLWRDVHREMGFAAFQRLVTLTAFEAGFFATKKDRLLGPEGGWREMNGRLDAHERITDACLSHHSVDRLDTICAPALVIHMGRDQITPPRLSVPIETHIPGATGVMMADSAHVPTGREQREFFDTHVIGFLKEN